MTILDRLNLRPMPMFEAEGAGAGDAGAGTKAPPSNALDAGGEGDGDAGDQGDKGDKGGQQQRADALTDLPENWREFIAGDDDVLKSELGRVKSPKDLGKRFKDMREKLSKGLDLNEAAPEDAEKLKEWRTARGIPPDPTGYKVPDAIKSNIKDVDKPIVDGYMEFMHKRNATQLQIDSGLEFYFGMEAAAAADREAADALQTKEATGVFKEMWGADFKANAQIAKRAAAELVSDTNLFDARLPDGRKIGNIPEFGDLLVQLGLMKWGEGAYEAGKGGSNGLGDELASLKKEMSTDMKKWRTNKAGQARYLELLEQQEKRGGR